MAAEVEVEQLTPAALVLRVVGQRLGVSAPAVDAGNTAVDFKTPGGNTVKSIILQPTPVTAETLDKVITAGWYVTKAEICAGADTTKVPACK